MDRRTLWGRGRTVILLGAITAVTMGAALPGAAVPTIQAGVAQEKEGRQEGEEGPQRRQK